MIKAETVFLALGTAVPEGESTSLALVPLMYLALVPVLYLALVLGRLLATILSSPCHCDITFPLFLGVASYDII